MCCYFSLSLDIEGVSRSNEANGRKGWNLLDDILWELINRKVSMEMVMSTLATDKSFANHSFHPLLPRPGPFLLLLHRVSAARE